MIFFEGRGHQHLNAMPFLVLLAVAHDLLGDILGNLGVGVGLHYVLTAALCLGTHVGSVTEHLGGS